MSRVGQRPIPIPPGVEVEIDNHQVTVKGSKGELSRSLSPDISVDRVDSQLQVTRPADGGRYRAMHGLTRTLVANMIEGVSKGFQKTLELQGVGYRAQKSGDKLVLQLGFSHPVEINPPPGITINVEGTNRVHILGIDKEQVGEQAAQIRRIRPPEPYQGKGIRYQGERIRRKAGKAGKAGGKRK